ncbi:retrovirus-related Pol polyprotein from transposon 17.6 [Trichonephila clavipes]|nr:retrovirus-related Pol polyprotein from transposon 17.6 [Trichonephila clavipes]
MLREGIIITILSPYVSPVVLCLKNNGLPTDNPEADSFVVDYCKLNAITRYPRYALPLIEYLITNIPHTAIMISLDLWSEYFQFAVNPSDVVNPPSGEHGFFCPTREASKTDHTEFFVRPGTHQK